jgi:hypothetical protein
MDPVPLSTHSARIHTHCKQPRLRVYYLVYYLLLFYIFFSRESFSFSKVTDLETFGNLPCNLLMSNHKTLQAGSVYHIERSSRRRDRTTLLIENDRVPCRFHF